MTEWLKVAGCKPVGVGLRRFESYPLHQLEFEKQGFSVDNKKVISQHKAFTEHAVKFNDQHWELIITLSERLTKYSDEESYVCIGGTERYTDFIKDFVEIFANLDIERQSDLVQYVAHLAKVDIHPPSKERVVH